MGQEEAKTIVDGAVVVVIAESNDFIYNFYDIHHKAFAVQN